MIKYIATLNQYSEHPLAEAIVKYGTSKNTSMAKIDDFEAIAGKGVTGTIDGQKIALGNTKLLEQQSASISDDLKTKVLAEQEQGKTTSYIMVNQKVVGYVTIYDALKKTSQNAIRELQKAGIDVIMLTGDNQRTAKAVADQLNLKHYILLNNT